MADIVSIELLPDPTTETRIREDWDRLARAGLSSMGAHPSPSNRPHVTLVVRPVIDPVDLTRALAALPIALVLDEPVVFAHGDRGVLAWRVVPSDNLVRLHEVVHRTVGPGEDAAHTAPGEWTPHITLARRLRLDALDEARGLLGPAFEGEGVAMRRWDSAAKRVEVLGEAR